MEEKKRSNGGYEIIESCTIGSTELVIGHNPKAPKLDCLRTLYRNVNPRIDTRKCGCQNGRTAF